MDYNYVSEGGITISGNSFAYRRKFIHFKYGPGSTLFLSYKAKMGVLERVTIKRIDVWSNYKTNFLKVPIYVDTLNAFYNESDLCTEADAVSLAKELYQKQINGINNLLSH